MQFKRRLPIPKQIKELYPLSPAGSEARLKSVHATQTILSGEDSRLLLLIGPCSSDREDAVMEYLGRLSRLREQVCERIHIVPRLYTGKPRTSGNAYKGMLHKPDPTGEPDILKGLLSIRRLHLKALEETAFGCADEMLYPETLRFTSDLLAYATIGARSVEDQAHKLTASGLEIPVGMKNPMNGDLKELQQAIATAQNGHLFIYRNWEVESEGNPYAHGILRGYTDSEGLMHSNAGAEQIEKVCELFSGLQNPALIVDCNHANSGKDYLKQIDLARNIAGLHKTHGIVKGLMIESYLQDGAQDEHGCEFGKSITDPCLGWEKTEKLVLELAELWQ